MLALRGHVEVYRLRSRSQISVYRADASFQQEKCTLVHAGTLAELAQKMVRVRSSAGIRVVVRWVAITGLSVSTLRICSLLFEAWAVTSETRKQDIELLEVCASGVAGQSPKMRDVCLRARSDVASPLLIKVILTAISVAYLEFSTAISTPWRLGILVLFVFSTAVSGPVIFWVRTFARVASLASQVDDSNPETASADSRVVIIPSDMHEIPPGAYQFQRGIRRVLNLRRRMFPQRFDIEDITTEACADDHFDKSL